MKTFLCSATTLFVISIVANAQTLKWSHTVELGSGKIGYIERAVVGTAGATVVVLWTGDENINDPIHQSFPDQKILWLSGTGRVLGTIDVSTPASGYVKSILNVTATRISILVQLPSAGVAVKNYQKSGKTLKETATEFSDDEFVLPFENDQGDKSDPTGFFVFKDASAVAPTIQRYNFY